MTPLDWSAWVPRLFLGCSTFHYELRRLLEPFDRAKSIILLHHYCHPRCWLHCIQRDQWRHLNEHLSTSSLPHSRFCQLGYSQLHMARVAPSTVFSSQWSQAYLCFPCSWALQFRWGSRRNHSSCWWKFRLHRTGQHREARSDWLTVQIFRMHRGSINCSSLLSRASSEIRTEWKISYFVFFLVY